MSAPKRKKEPFEVPASQVLIKKKKEDIFGTSLMRLQNTNTLNSKESRKLMEQATEAGLDFKHPFQHSATQDEPEEGKAYSNAARSFRRWQRQSQVWGELYWATIPVWNRKKKETETALIPFLLPHQVMSQYLALEGTWNEGMPAPGTFLYAELSKVCAAWKEPVQGMFPLAIHGDGVPVQGRTNQSTLDFLTFNLPGSLKKASVRIPICCLDAQYNCGAETIEAIWSIIAWSLESLGKGKHPCTRHDGSPFSPKEKTSLDKAGQNMPGKCALVHIRGDWDFFCKWLGVPQFNVLEGMRWRCSCRPNQWKEWGRGDRMEKSLSKAQFLESVRSRGKVQAAIFRLPGFTNHNVHPDWMHTVDEGFGALICGQVLSHLLPEYGKNKDEQIKNLWKDIQELYTKFQVPWDKRLAKLTLLDIKKPKRVAELDAKANDIRHFALWLESLCKAKSLRKGNMLQKAVYNVARFCTEMYKALENFDPPGLVANGEKLLSQYMALEACFAAADDDQSWHSKPKCHLLQHILDDVHTKGLCPKDTWTYRDETFGSTLQGFYTRRGGHRNVGLESERVLLAFMSTQPWLGAHTA